MVIDTLIDGIMDKQSPCVVGIDPEWNKLPLCYRAQGVSPASAILAWARDVIDVVAPFVPAVKPQMAFFEVFGAEGVRVHQAIVQYAHDKGLIVIDDSKRNDIGNTARAYAFAHLAKEGPINADFLTVSPFLGTDSLQPFIDTAVHEEKGLFVLVKTSNPSSAEISEALNPQGEKLRNWLARYVHTIGSSCTGQHGYSAIGAVVGATFPDEARQLRAIMKNSFFLVPGFGAQGGTAEDIAAYFNTDGLGAVISSSRGILYHHLTQQDYDQSRNMYLQMVKTQACTMQQEIYAALQKACPFLQY